MKMYIDNIGMDTIESEIRNKQRMRVTNFGVKYIKRPLKEESEVMRRAGEQSEIIEDFSV